MKINEKDFDVSNLLISNKKDGKIVHLSEALFAGTLAIGVGAGLLYMSIAAPIMPPLLVVGGMIAPATFLAGCVTLSNMMDKMDAVVRDRFLHAVKSIVEKDPSLATTEIKNYRIETTRDDITERSYNSNALGIKGLYTGGIGGAVAGAAVDSLFDVEYPKKYTSYYEQMVFQYQGNETSRPATVQDLLNNKVHLRDANCAKAALASLKTVALEAGHSATANRLSSFMKSNLGPNESKTSVSNRMAPS